MLSNFKRFLDIRRIEYMLEPIGFRLPGVPYFLPHFFIYNLDVWFHTNHVSSEYSRGVAVFTQKDFLVYSNREFTLYTKYGTQKADVHPFPIDVLRQEGIPCNS